MLEEVAPLVLSKSRFGTVLVSRGLFRGSFGVLLLLQRSKCL